MKGGQEETCNRHEICADDEEGPFPSLKFRQCVEVDMAWTVRHLCQVDHVKKRGLHTFRPRA